MARLFGCVWQCLQGEKNTSVLYIVRLIGIQLENERLSNGRLLFKRRLTMQLRLLSVRYKVLALDFKVRFIACFEIAAMLVLLK